MQVLRNQILLAEDHPLLGDARFRILDLSPREECLILFELGLLPRAKKPFIVSTEQHQEWSECNLIRPVDETTPRIMTLTDSKIPKKKIDKRDARFSLIDPLVSDPEFLWEFASQQRCKRVVELAKELSILAIEIYRVLWRFWEYGQIPNALLDNTEDCGAPGREKPTGTKPLGAPLKVYDFVKRTQRKVIVGERDKEIFLDALRQVILKVKANLIRFSFAEVYRETQKYSPYIDEIELATAQGRAAHIPTMRQFRRALGKLATKADIDKAILPKHVWAKDFRGVTGSATALACVPGSRYEIDSTIADVYIVSEFDRNLVLGRPTIYVVVCVASRMIVGFHVSLKWASWKCARQALYNAFTDSVSFCDRHGFTITKEEWPCEGIPTRVFADRGEMVGDQPRVLTQMLGANIEIAPSFRSDAKGIVERQFGIANEELHLTPGTTLGQLKQRGLPDYRDRAVLTLHELTANLCSKFHYNNTQTLYDDLITEGLVAADLAHTPVNFWNHHVEQGRHSLKRFTKNQIIAGLLPSANASVRRDGIFANGIGFTCDRAEQEHWYSRSRHSGRWKLEAKADLGWSSNLFVRVEGESDFIACDVLNSEKLMRNRHPDDLEFLNEWKLVKSQSASRNLAAVQHRERSERTIENASREKASTPTDQSKSKLRRGINDRRREVVSDPVERGGSTSEATRNDRAVARALRLVRGNEDSDSGKYERSDV